MICSRTPMGCEWGGQPYQCSLGVAACYLSIYADARSIDAMPSLFQSPEPLILGWTESINALFAAVAEYSRPQLQQQQHRPLPQPELHSTPPRTESLAPLPAVPAVVWTASVTTLSLTTLSQLYLFCSRTLVGHFRPRQRGGATSWLAMFSTRCFGWCSYQVMP